MQEACRIHPMLCKAGLQGSLTSLSPFPYLLVLQWNTTFGGHGVASVSDYPTLTLLPQTSLSNWNHFEAKTSRKRTSTFAPAHFDSQVGRG